MVALARAVYRDADIVLMDDVLAAVDVHVRHHPRPQWEGNIYPVSRSVSIRHIVAGKSGREKRATKKGITNSP